jgi:RNA ligase (TIGR02306 family)
MRKLYNIIKIYLYKLFNRETKSTHVVEVIKVKLLKHSNADSLSIVMADGYQAVVRTDDWVDGQLGAYIPPDSMVNTNNPLFEFLLPSGKPKGTLVRIKARRLRGEWSMGLLVPAPKGSKERDNVAGILGVTHYNPPEPKRYRPGMSGKMLKAQCAKGPSLNFPVPKYDVDAFRKYATKTFEPGELVWVTEKIHGTNARFVYDGKDYHCGSHTTWKKSKDDPSYNSHIPWLYKKDKPSEDCVWWKCLHQYPALKAFLKENPNTVVYGEIYGWIQDLRYDHKQDEFSLAVFDVMRDGRWLDAEEGYHLMTSNNIPTVPLFGTFEYDYDRLITMAEGNSEFGANIREGIVVKSIKEKYVPHVGRANLKIVSNNYLERA